MSGWQWIAYAAGMAAALAAGPVAQAAGWKWAMVPTGIALSAIAALFVIGV